MSDFIDEAIMSQIRAAEGLKTADDKKTKAEKESIPKLRGGSVAPEYHNPDKLAIQHPSRSMLLGGTGVGKTFFVVNMLQRKHKLKIGKKSHTFHANWNRVMWIAPQFSIEQPILQEVLKKDLGDDLSFFAVSVAGGISEEDAKAINDQLQDNHSRGLQTLIVTDDLTAVTKDKRTLQFVDELAISGRHKSASLMTLTQRAFSTASRASRLQLNYLVLFRIGSSEVMTVLRQTFPDKAKEIYQLYEYAIRSHKAKAGGYLMIDLDAPLVKGRSNLEFRVNSLDTAATI